MADFFSGFDAVNNALQFAGGMRRQREQDEYQKTLDRQAQEHRQSMLGYQAEDLALRQKAQQALEGWRSDQHNLAVDQQLFEQDQAFRKNMMRQGMILPPGSAAPQDSVQHLPFVGPPSPQTQAPSSGSQAQTSPGAQWVRSGMTIGSDGFPQYTYKAQYPVEPPQFITQPTPDGGQVSYEVTTDPATGQKKYGRVPQSETEPIKDAKVTAANIRAALSDLKHLEEVVDKYGNFEIDFPGITEAKDWLYGKSRGMKASEASAALGALPYELAISIAKIVDPGSVAREGEVAAAKEFEVPMGITSSNAATLEAIKRLRDKLRKRTEFLGLLDLVPEFGGAAPATSQPQWIPDPNNPGRSIQVVWED